MNAVADPWLDPNSIECLCGRCQRGKPCRSMRTMWADYRTVQDAREKAQALTVEDRVWLESQGWECPAPPHRSLAA